MFTRLGSAIMRHRFLVVALYLAALPVLAWIGHPVIRMLKAGGLEDPGRESWQVKARIEKELGLGQADVVAIYSSESAEVDELEVMEPVLAVIDTLEKQPEVNRVLSYFSTGIPQLVSKDRHRTFIVVYLKGDDQEKIDSFQRLQPLLRAKGLDVQFAGATPTYLALFGLVERDMVRAELIALPLTAGLLVFIFGSLAATALPLAVGLFSILLAFALLRLVLMFTAVSIFAANTITVLGLGLAVDYSLFMVTRFREDLDELGVEGALQNMLNTTGRAVLFSGITVAASLMGLWVFPQVFLRALALGGVVIVAGTILLSLTLLPALLAILGPKVDAWRVPFVKLATRGEAKPGLGFRATLAIMRRPISGAILVTLFLLTLAVPFHRFEPSIPDHRVLPAGEPVREAHALLDREFQPNEVTPVDLLLTTEGPALNRDTLASLYAFRDRVQAVPGIGRVDSIFSLDAFVSREKMLDLLTAPPEAQNPEVATLLKLFVNGSTVRFSVVSQHLFNSREALAEVDQLRALPPPPHVQRLEVGGPSAMLADLKLAIAERTPWMLLSVGLVMFLVLFLAFGSVTLPFKAMLMNSLSLTASFGAIVWVFQDGRFADLLGYTPLGFSDATQPLVMFAAVFGLSMDYEVLILTRVQEEYRRTGDNAKAVEHGLARTGQLITNAAALLVAVIGAFATSSIIFMKTMGLGMALAIALDATVVRALLVPATMLLMGKWNWYAPAFLVRWRQALGLG